MTILDRLAVVLGYDYDPKGVAKFEKAAARAQAKLDKVARAAGKVGAAITAAAVGVTQQFAGYETEMSKITGLVGISRDQLAAWQDDLLAIARETGQAPKQLAEALFFVTSAGLRGQDAMDALRESAKAAAAGLGDQATIVDLVTSAMNAYGPSTLTAQNATDALTEAARLGKLEPPQLAAAMGRVLPVASAMGVSFNEVAGLMAAMSKTGTTAEEAVTQLNAVMSGLLKPSVGAEKAMEAMGLSAQGLRDMLGEKGLFETLVYLRQELGEDNQAFAKIFPNIRALRGIFDLMGPQLDSNRQLLDDMADSTGVLDEAFQAGENTIGRTVAKLKADFQATIIENGDAITAFAKIMTESAKIVLKAVTGVVDAMGPFRTAFLVAGPVLLGVAGAAKVLSVAIGAVSTAVKFATWVHGLFAKAAVGTRIAMYAEAAAKTASAAAQWLLNAAVTAFPVLLIIAAIAAAVAAIWYFRDEIWAFLEAAWDKITGVFEAIGGFFADLGPMFYNAGRDLITALVDGIVSMALAPYKAVKEALGFVRDLLPFSDAKEGPLSNLTESGRRLTETIALGVDASGADLAGALARIFPDPLSLVAPLPVGPVPAAVGVATPVRGGDRNLSVTVEKIEVVAQGADAAEISGELAGELKRQIRSVVEEFDSDIDA